MDSVIIRTTDMNIQIIADPKVLLNDEALFKKIESLFLKFKREYQSLEVLWILPKMKYLVSDLYLQVFSNNKIKIGFLPKRGILKIKSIFPYIHPEDLHWTIIEDGSINKLDLLSKMLCVVVGMTCIPSQTGSHMCDLADLKTALQMGDVARYIEISQFGDESRDNSREIVSSLMLLNGNGKINEKLDIVANCVSIISIDKDCLNIMNLIDSNLIPNINTLLLVYKSNQNQASKASERIIPIDDLCI